MSVYVVLASHNSSISNVAAVCFFARKNNQAALRYAGAMDAYIGVFYVPGVLAVYSQILYTCGLNYQVLDMLELNPIYGRIKDMQGRVESLRGYL